MFWLLFVILGVIELIIVVLQISSSFLTIIGYSLVITWIAYLLHLIFYKKRQYIRRIRTFNR